MNQIYYSFCFILVALCSISLYAKEKCDNCIATEDCQTYKELNRYEQSKWRERFNCPESNEKDIPLGFSSTAKGDLVCCPANVWGVENPSHEDHSYTNTDANIPRPNSDSDLNRRDGFNYQPNRNYNNRPINTGNNNWGNRGGIRDDYDEFGRPYWQRRAKQNYVENPYFLPANGNNGGSKNFKEPSNPQQCPVTSFPPDPASGCCGLEASNNDGINSQLNAQYDPNANRRNNWMPQMNYQSSESWPSWMSRSNYGRRSKRQENITVTIDNRIAGGKETDLEQFPWTVLLKTTFVYPTKEAAFACGGSLISSRYVLTAGHCVFDAQGKIKGIEVTLAEYDKRTSPRDCKFSLSRGEVCVENVVMNAEDYILHPDYDNERLYNDIAIVRLQRVAPYTNYIRPICLPPLDIDNPELTNLKLAVAGWGRNGRYKSNIKQSTVVNLVPQKSCRNSYPNLNRNQVCAAGYSGEDTCKGDSGGPLMMNYNDKYYLSGVVSGKRADAPCGTSVPSLYTNVYRYLPWIRSVIRN